MVIVIPVVVATNAFLHESAPQSQWGGPVLTYAQCTAAKAPATAAELRLVLRGRLHRKYSDGEALDEAGHFFVPANEEMARHLHKNGIGISTMLSSRKH